MPRIWSELRQNLIICAIELNSDVKTMGSRRRGGQNGTVALPWNVKSWYCHPPHPYKTYKNTRISALKFKIFCGIAQTPTLGWAVGLWRPFPNHTPSAVPRLRLSPVLASSAKFSVGAHRIASVVKCCGGQTRCISLSFSSKFELPLWQFC